MRRVELEKRRAARCVVKAVAWNRNIFYVE